MKYIRFFLTLVCGAVLASLCFLSVVAQEPGMLSPEVVITAEVPTTVYSKKMVLPLAIQFHNEALYTKDLYVSYHVLDSEQKMLVMEAPRTLVPPPTNGVSIVGIEVDLNKFKELRTYRELVVQLDIVDVEKAYWMQQTPGVTISAPLFYYHKDLGKHLLYTSIQALKEHPVIAAVNVLLLVLLFAGVWSVKRRARARR